MSKEILACPSGAEEVDGCCAPALAGSPVHIESSFMISRPPERAEPSVVHSRREINTTTLMENVVWPSASPLPCNRNDCRAYVESGVDRTCAGRTRWPTWATKATTP
jgi:hypothetical protein